MAAPEINKGIFKEEAYELLAELETSLMELESRPEDQDLIGRVFRAMHTIKGSGSMFGFENIASFTHDVETAFDLVRTGKIPVSKELIDITLRARDQIRLMLDEDDADSDAQASERLSLLEELKSVVAATDSGFHETEPCPASESSGEEICGEEMTYRIRFRPPQDIFLRGVDPLSLVDDVCALGFSNVVAQTDAIAFLDEIDPEQCFTYWDIILTTDRGINAIRDIFIFVEDDSEIRIDLIQSSHISDDAGSRKIGEILIERGDLSVADLNLILGQTKKIGERLVESGRVSPDQIASALAEQQHVREIQEKRQAKESSSSIRVASEKLDMLVNLIGELVTVQAHLSQTAAGGNDAKLLSIAEEVERLTAELRDNTMNIRMLPIGTTFSKFKRLVRDLSRELGKEIELETEGGETELDKTVIEKLNDPLVHIIRNSIDHGIEQPDVRRASGKPAAGIIRLSAFHSGANVVVQIRDDGKGLDREAIRTKAVERGLIVPDADLTDKELFALILQPGFSTAQKLTSVSGRGVGMDVVKQAIDALKGSIVIASEKGAGSAISLTLPLTLAIIDGLLVRIGEDFFVFPLSAVKECIELSSKDVADTHGRHLVNVRGTLVSYIDLRERFSTRGERPEIQQVVITEHELGRIGFVVDAVIGQHQTVIKSLGSFYRTVSGLSGATILGDGTVALILDIARLIADEERQELRMTAQF